MCRFHVTPSGATSFEDCVVSELSVADLIDVLTDRIAATNGLDFTSEEQRAMLAMQLACHKPPMGITWS